MNTITKRGLLAAAGLGTAFLITGCGKGGAVDPRTLHFGNSAEPLTLDPHKASGTWENHIIGDMFLGLTTEDQEAKPIPGMAVSWTTSADGLVWTFKLRDMKWSDGVPVTADDFVYAYRRILDPATLSDYAAMMYVIKNGEKVYNKQALPEALGVRAIDALTLELTLEHPAPYLPQQLMHYTAYPVPKHLIERVGVDWIKPENIVVNGPYKLKEWKTNNYVLVEKNPLWPDVDKLCFDKVYFYPTNDVAAAERRVRAGELDINTEFGGQRRSLIEKQLPGYVRVSDYIGTIFLTMNTKKAPFDDPRVRRALALALDREFLAEKILGAGEKPAYALVPRGTADYTNGPQADFANMPLDARRAEAKTLLEAAGFGPAKPLIFTLTHRNTADNPRMAPVYQENWRAIAPWVQPEIQSLETQIHYQNLRTGDYEVGDGGWILDFNDARNMLYLLETRSKEQNYSKYSNPEFDALMMASDLERDAAKRSELMKKAEALYLRDMPMIPVVSYVAKRLVSPKIEGWVDNLTDIHRIRYLCRTK